MEIPHPKFILCVWWWGQFNICIGYKGTWRNFTFVEKNVNYLGLSFPLCVCLNEGRWLVKSSPPQWTRHFYEAQGNVSWLLHWIDEYSLWPNPLYDKMAPIRPLVSCISWSHQIEFLTWWMTELSHPRHLQLLYLTARRAPCQVPWNDLKNERLGFACSLEINGKGPLETRIQSAAKTLRYAESLRRRVPREALCPPISVSPACTLVAGLLLCECIIA